MKPKIVFATKETIIQPKSLGLVLEAPQEQDHILGGPIGSIAGPDFDVLVEDGQWANYAPKAEVQLNRYGDTFMCVSFSKNNVDEFIALRKYGETINFSDIFLGKGSGTVRNSGNGKRAVAEWKRLNGFVTEEEYPFTPDMTLDQVYQAIPADLIKKAIKNLAQYSFFYKWLGNSSPQSLMEGLKYSPLQVDVTGSYPMDANGYVIWSKSSPVYAHEVVIFGYELGKCWHVFDSEASQFIRFAWDYPFGSPMIHSVKKNMKIRIYKKKGQSALAVKHCSEPSLIAFSGGSVQGGDLFKSLYGVKDFKEIEITEVDEFPFPIRHLINTNPQR